MSGEVLFAGKAKIGTAFQVSRSVDFDKEIILLNVRVISGTSGNGYNDDMGMSIIGPPTDSSSRYPYVTAGSGNSTDMNGLVINGTGWTLQKSYSDGYTAYVLIIAIPRTDV